MKRREGARFVTALPADDMKTAMFFVWCCKKRRGGTYLVRYGYDFTCSCCGRRYQSLRNIILNALGLIDA